VVAKAAAARSLRVLWKLASGSYPASELLLHARTLVGGKSWEQQRLEMLPVEVRSPNGAADGVEIESTGDESDP
jgi:hypothetical protein